MDLIDIELEQKLTANCQIFSKNLVLYRQRAKQLAELIISPDGQINFEKIELLKNINLEGDFQASLDQDFHIKSLLKKISEDKIFQKKIINFDFPISLEFEKFVYLALNIDPQPLSKAHLRKSVVQALFGYLRQTVGSCFATAPCLYILKRHADYFLDDLYLLSKKSCLQRITSGHLTEVPMALSIGEHFLSTIIQKSFLDDSLFEYFKIKNQLTENLEEGRTFLSCLGKNLSFKLYLEAHDPLLKIWEYTVASLCDAKGEFSESTLYLTLGLDAKASEGLGQFFMDLFQNKLNEKHELVLQAQNEAYLAHQRLVMAEQMAKNATTEASFHRSKSEIIAASYQVHSRQLDIDDFKKQELKIKTLYEKKLHALKEMIPKFFQESYDPDLVNMKSYNEDAPAGFRLFVKDNQLNSRFKAIETEDDFVKALKLFFEQLEQKIITSDVDKESQHTLTNFITETIQFSSSKSFLEKTYLRAKQRHPKALPWAYVSGGTLETLLKTYFRKEILPVTKIKGDDLNQFFIELIDHFKSLPENYLEPFRKNPYLSLLIETKTHACQLMPGSKMFRHLWESTGFTYTEIRDFISEKGKQFYNKHHLTLIPKEFFIRHGKDFSPQPVGLFLKNHANHKEALFLVSSFLISQLPVESREKEAGYCKIGDTNWTYESLIIGYSPLTESLAFFAQDPESLGLFFLDNMQHFPLQWKIYDDLSRLELFIPGIKI
jgi:hypothetical protein